MFTVSDEERQPRWPRRAPPQPRAERVTQSSPGPVLPTGAKSALLVGLAAPSTLACPLPRRRQACSSWAHLPPSRPPRGFCTPLCLCMCALGLNFLLFVFLPGGRDVTSSRKPCVEARVTLDAALRFCFPRIRQALRETCAPHAPSGAGPASRMAHPGSQAILGCQVLYQSTS